MCSIAAFSATSSSRFFGSPTATLLYPGSDRPPASATGCSHPATASPLAPDSHPSRHTSPSRHTACASIPPVLVPHPPPPAQLPLASAHRSSALPCACSSTYLLPLSFAKIILSFVRKQGSQNGMIGDAGQHLA